MTNDANPFAFLNDRPADEIASLLSGESTRVAGVVLSHVSRTVAAQVLADIPEAQRKQVVQSMAEARTISRPVLETLADTVRQKSRSAPRSASRSPSAPSGAPSSAQPRLSAPPSRISDAYATPGAKPTARRSNSGTPRPPVGKPTHSSIPGASVRPSRASPASPASSPPPRATVSSAAAGTSRRDSAMREALSLAQEKRKIKTPAGTTPIPVHGAALAAEILRQSGADVRNLLAKEEPALFKKLCKRSYVFDDLEHTSDSALGTLFQDVEPETAALALRFASDALQERVLANTSPRRAKWIAEEMERGAAHPVGIRDIEAAQQTVLDKAISLQSAGRILIDPDDMTMVP